MCVSPLHIRNPKKGLDPRFDKAFIDVPCGHCWQCRLRKKNDAWLRLYFEYLDTENKGGFTLFLTLTYSNKYLPRIGNFSCFSHRHIQLYLKRIRKRFGANVRYWFCEELGSHTHRPHYHIVFFVTNHDSSYFRKFVRDAWYYGFTSVGRYNYGIVNNCSGLKYIAKYCGKQISDVSYVSGIFKLLDSSACNKVGCKLFSEYSDNVKYRVTPRTRGSNYLGIFALSVTSYNDLLHNRVVAPNNKNVNSFFALPFSLYRHSHCSKVIVHDMLRYTLNDFGLKSRITLFKSYCDAFLYRFKQCLECPLDSVLSSRVNALFLVKDYKRFLQLFNPLDLFHYAIIYQGVICSPSSASKYDFLSDYSYRLQAQNLLATDLTFSIECPSYFLSHSSFFDKCLCMINTVFRFLNLRREEEDLEYQRSFETHRFFIQNN